MLSGPLNIGVRKLGFYLCFRCFRVDISVHHAVRDPPLMASVLSAPFLCVPGMVTIIPFTAKEQITFFGQT